MQPIQNRALTLALAALCLGGLSCRRPKAPPAPARPDTGAPAAVTRPAHPPLRALRALRTTRGRAAPAAATTWSFDRAEPTPLPPGFSASSGRWELTLESARGRNRVLAQTAVGPEPAFHVVLAEAPTGLAEPVDLAVRLRAVSGKLDQGGGLIWRARDAKNYYLARYNPLEDNLHLYRVQKGKRTLIKEAPLKTAHAAWHTLRVTMQRDRIQVHVDRHALLSARDATFAGPGRIGLWTKADAVTQFDDLTLGPAAR